MTPARRLATIVGTAVAAIVVSTSSAFACQIDNDGSDGRTLDVWFSCGLTCGAYYKDIKPGTSVSYPGTSGTVNAGTHGNPLYCEEKGTETMPVLGKHGQAGVTWKLDTANNPDKLKSSFTWESKGGNDWTGSVVRTGYGDVFQNGFCWYGRP
ncbi:MAG: hypothetical protein WAL70_01425 [Aeromicrobium sp.]